MIFNYHALPQAARMFTRTTSHVHNTLSTLNATPSCRVESRCEHPHCRKCAARVLQSRFHNNDKQSQTFLFHRPIRYHRPVQGCQVTLACVLRKYRGLDGAACTTTTSEADPLTCSSTRRIHSNLIIPWAEIDTRSKRACSRRAAATQEADACTCLLTWRLSQI